MSVPADLVAFMKEHEETLKSLGMSYMWESDDVVELHHDSGRALMFDARLPNYRKHALIDAVALLARIVIERDQ